MLLPGESQGQWSLVGCHLWGHTELDTTEATQQQQQQQPCCRTESDGARGRKGQESLRTGSWRCLEVLGPQFFPAMKFHGVWTWMSLDSWEE